MPSMVDRTPQDGVTMARMLPGASFAAGDGRDPTPTGGGAALGAQLAVSVSETLRTELEIAPGPRGSRSFSLFGFSGSNIQERARGAGRVFWLLRQLWQ